MSKFLVSDRFNLVPYTPGEQPKDMKYIKLNTNESPYPPSEKAVLYAKKGCELSNLYPDPTCSALSKKLAEFYDVDYENIILTNGSDEALNFSFIAFCNKDKKAVFPDITYGFYSVFAELNNVPYEEIPLEENFKIDINKYKNNDSTVFIANPNAPTGLILSISQIEEIVIANKDNVVIIDEAYIDFGGESAIPLTKKYDNLLVIQTFSKSRSMAGARLGYAIGNKELISDLNLIKYSTNPYNINRMTMESALGILEDNSYVEENLEKIITTRDYTNNELSKLNFEFTDSKANFVFAKHSEKSGKYIYEELKKRGILVRHFDKERIKEYNRITIGTKEEMEILIKTLSEILEGK